MADSRKNQASNPRPALNTEQAMFHKPYGSNILKPINGFSFGGAFKECLVQEELNLNTLKSQTLYESIEAASINFLSPF